MSDPADYLGPVRPYVLTGGQVHPSRNTIRPETLLVTHPDLPLPISARRQHRALVQMCQGGMLSLAEAAAHLTLPVSVVAIMVSELVDSGHLGVRTADLPDRAILERVLHALREL